MPARSSAVRRGRASRMPSGRRYGMTLLMYGTRDPREVCYYPRSGKVFFIGLGLVTRVGERLDYWEGEE